VPDRQTRAQTSSTPEQCARWSRATNYFPVRGSAVDGLTDYFAENPQFEKAFGFLNHDIVTEPGIVAYDECRDSIGEMLGAVVVGGDPATWLTGTLEECNAFMQGLAPDWRRALSNPRTAPPKRRTGDRGPYGCGPPCFNVPPAD
jgi:hypothetical protein